MNKANVRLIMSMFTIVILLSGMAIAQVYTRSSDRTRGLSGDQQKVEQGQPLKATQPAGPAQYWQSLSEKEKIDIYQWRLCHGIAVARTFAA